MNAAQTLHLQDTLPSRLRHWRHAGLASLGLWLAAALAWSAWAPISGAVVGTGRVKVEADRQTVSHRDGGTVGALLVHEGQHVQRGQPLIVLQDMRIDSALQLLQVQLATERLRRARLEAEVARQPAWRPPPTIADAPDAARVAEAAARERAAFDARRRTLDGQLQAAAAQVHEFDTEVRAHLRNDTASTEALALLREEIRANEVLAQQNFVNRTRVLALKRGVADYEARIETARADAAQARQRKAELEGRQASLIASYVQQAAEDLRDSTARIADLEERLRAGADTAGRQVVTAPVDGVLVNLRVNTVGSAIGPREPIVDVVPADRPLVIETRLGLDAISDVRPGLVAEVRLLGVRQREVPLLEGRVTQVSADALADEHGGPPFFRLQVEVAPAAAAAAAVALRPGMAAEVFVKTAQRSPLEFLLEPLTAGMRRAFREH